MTETDQILTSQQRNKWILYILLWAATIAILSWLYGSKDVHHLNGDMATPEEINKALLIFPFINIPLIGFIIGAFVAFLPYKGASYRQKYLRSALLVTLVLEALMCAIAVFGVASIILGGYGEALSVIPSL